MDTTRDYDIAIIGAGPTGLVLTAYLGQAGISTVIIEKEEEVQVDPRGIALDEDGIRILQGIGLYEKVFTKIGQPMGYFNFITSANDLHIAPFIRFNFNTVEGGTGHPGYLSHKQPVLETCIRERLAAISCVDMRLGCIVTSISENDDLVYVGYESRGQTKTVVAKFCVGCDDYSPTPDTHPDFPLWKLGFDPEDVYDNFFPRDFRFICNPDRPSVCGRFGPPAERLWRFEFVVKKDENGTEMAKFENVQKIVFPYLKHDGYRYGLREPVKFPVDCIKVLRSRPFNFAARTCNKWSLGRVILAGDAAHVLPPFGGQGIASAFRDALALSWRLSYAVTHASIDYEALLRTWYTEREQQLDHSLAITIENGNYCNEPSWIKSALRNIYCPIVALVPTWRHEQELGMRREGMTTYPWTEDSCFPKNIGGKCMPQIFIRGNGLFSDDVIFANKTAVMQILVLLDNVAEVPVSQAEILGIGKISAGFLDEYEATFLVHSDESAENTSVIFPKTRDELFAERFSPPPYHYDHLRLRKEVPFARYIICRPDRFVFFLGKR